MPTIEERAREALNAVSRERDDYARWDASDRREDIIAIETTCRLIEEFDAFKQEVSDAVDGWVKADRISADARRSACVHLVTFIIPKPVDPLVEAIREASVSDADDGDASRLRAALAKRGAILSRGWRSGCGRRMASATVTPAAKPNAAVGHGTTGKPSLSYRLPTQSSAESRSMVEVKQLRTPKPSQTN